MMKVEAVVVRDRVETVMEAVEAETGHVGVTVIEAVGHGREKGITHEYRGRVFESRFLPKALMTFVVRDEIAEDVIQAITDAARTGHATATASAGCRPSAASPTTGPEQARGGGAGMSTKELAFAASTIWVVLAAILVLFMQAGFAFLEAGLTRMKNVGHIAAKNVLDPRDRLDRLLPRRLRASRSATAATASSAARASCPSVDELLAIGAEPFSWFAAIPGAAAYLFEVAFAAVSLAIVWGAMAERTRLWVYVAFGIAFTLIYSVVSHWIWSPDGWLFAKGMQDFAGSTVVHYQGALAGLAGALLLGPRIGKFVDGKPQPIPGSQHGVHDARRDHPLVRLVRVQPGLDALRRLRRRRLLRVRRAQHEPRRGGRRARRRDRVVDRDQEARPLDDAERRDRGARRDHRGVRVRRPVGGDPDRLRRRRDRRARVAARRAGRDRRPGRRARRARHGRRLGHARARVPDRAEARRERSRPGSGGLFYGGGLHQLGVQALGLAAVGAFTFTRLVRRSSA